jgi:hypothetical protein
LGAELLTLKQICGEINKHVENHQLCGIFLLIIIDFMVFLRCRSSKISSQILTARVRLFSNEIFAILLEYKINAYLNIYRVKKQQKKNLRKRLPTLRT